MRKIWFLVITILFVSIQNSYSQKRLTLSEAMDIGMKNSKDLKISSSKIVGAEANQEVVKSQYFPQLQLSANYTRLSDVPSFVVDIPIFQHPITIAQTILNNYTFKLSLQQPLFTGFRIISQKNASEHLTEATRFDYQKDKNEAALGIRVAFWNYYKSLELKTVIDDNIKVITHHLEDTKNLMANGLATQNDILKLEVQLSNTKLIGIDADNNIDLARANLNKVLGFPLNAKTEISAEEIVYKDNFEQYTSLVDEALRNRSEILATGKRIEASEDNINASRSSYFPQVFLNGDYFYSRPNQRYQPPADNFHSTWDLGITLSWNIWTWGNTSGQVIQAEQNLIQNQTLKEQLMDNIELEVNQNYLNLKYSREKLDVLETTIQQAEENLRVTNEKYQHQLATSTDLVDAENSVINAQTNYKTALADYMISKTKLEKALGRKIY